MNLNVLNARVWSGSTQLRWYVNEMEYNCAFCFRIGAAALAHTEHQRQILAHKFSFWSWQILLVFFIGSVRVVCSGGFDCALIHFRLTLPNVKLKLINSWYLRWCFFIFYFLWSSASSADWHTRWILVRQTIRFFLLLVMNGLLSSECGSSHSRFTIRNSRLVRLIVLTHERKKL